MKYLLPLIVSIALAFSFEDSQTTNTQKEMSISSNINNNPCPDSLDSPHNVSANLIKVLLTSNSPTKQQERIDSGIDHLDFNDLELLSSPADNYACNQLSNFKDYWLEDKPNTEYTFYKIDNYYFMVSWYNGNMLGFQPVFVFNSQYELIGLWSI